jgi:hypothetical protein
VVSRFVIGALAATVLAAPVVAQNFNLPPAFGTLSLRANFAPDPTVVNLQAGGVEPDSKVPTQMSYWPEGGERRITPGSVPRKSSLQIQRPSGRLITSVTSAREVAEM